MSKLFLCFLVSYYLTCCWLVVLIKADLSSKRIPRVFSQDYLPGKLPDEGTKEYVHLGKIFKFTNVFQPKMVKTKFSIYTRHNSVQEITYGPEHYCYPDTCHGPFQYDLNALAESGFDPNKRTIVMTPGFLTDDWPDWILLAKDLWLQHEDVNVIMTTWKDGNRYIYNAAVANTPVVARQISILLYYLAQLHGADLNDQSFLDRIQLVGHSLGAHISGFVGKDFGGRLSRITGLDPAGPYFDRESRDRRLDKKDAQLVTIIHSNRGKLDYVKSVAGGVKDINKQIIDKIQSSDKNDEKELDGPSSLISVIDNGVSNPWFGIDDQVGDIDYYANDGAEQPGCKDFMHICDHGRSTELYGDMLRFELSRRSQSSSEDWLKSTRLLAFVSDDFNKFLNGHKLHEHCPSLIHRASTSEIEETFQRCSIPIDVVSPVSELKEELKNVYKIDLDHKDKPYTESTRFWFKTQDSSPFMGDHYLLKLEVDPHFTYWDDTCTLHAEASMAEGDKEIVINTNKGLTIINGTDFTGFAIPFVHPVGQEARVALNNILAGSKAVDKAEIPGITERVAKVAPAELHLSIATSNMNYVLGEDKDSDAEKCSLKLESIEIVPVIGNKRSLAAKYSTPKGENHQKGSPRGFLFSKNQSVRKSYKTDQNILSVNGNNSLVKKFEELMIEH